MGFDPAARGASDKSLSLIGNLFNPSTITKGFMVNTDGTLLANASYGATAYIPVEANKQYFFTNVRTIAFYDANKVLVSGTGASYTPTRDNFLVKTMPNAAFVRVTSLLTNMDNNIFYTVAKVQNPTRWSPKIWSSFGDSITEQVKWQPYVIDVLGFSHNSYGVGGTKVADTTGTDTTAMCRDERINLITSASNLITFMGGTNDWLNNVPLGTVSDTETNTFYGAVKKVAEKLITRFPDQFRRIVFMTTPYGKYPNRAGWTDTYGLKNNLNLTSGDYGKVIVEVARLYGLPCVDIYGMAGIHDINITTFMTNDGALIHPNDDGGKRIAEVVIGALRALEPIV